MIEPLTIKAETISGGERFLIDSGPYKGQECASFRISVAGRYVVRPSFLFGGPPRFDECYSYAVMLTVVMSYAYAHVARRMKEELT